MNQADMFEKALKRPANFAQLGERRQWEIDKELGILDWDGSCPHSKGFPCKDCEKRYFNR